MKEMFQIIACATILSIFASNVNSNDVLGCGGFVKSHVQIDFSKVEVKLLTKQGILKDKTTCAPNNGYYFLPIYDKGVYIIQLNPPPGWSFNPSKVELLIDGINDVCSKGVDINFSFKGFGITGRVENFGDASSGPEGVLVELKSETEIRKTETSIGGTFSFTPVYPGHYKIQVQHPRWKFLKEELQVRVVEGNTELPEGSLILHGYSVSGYARSVGEAISNTTILLYGKNKSVDPSVLGCDKSSIPNMPSHSIKPICAVQTNLLGCFTFASVVVGSYYVKPFYQNQNIDVEPSKIEFEITNGDVELEKSFEVIGFSVSGRILQALDQDEGLPNVEIFMNNKFVTKTDTNGFYKLEKLKTGVLKLKAKSENMLFEDIDIKVSPNTQNLPPIAPSAFRVCGKVESSQSHMVTIVKIGSTFFKNVNSDPTTGRFCVYLPKGTYEVQVQVEKVHKEKGLQFYPVSQNIEVFRENNEIIIFSQLKATLTGFVQLHHDKDYQNIQVFLNLLHSNEAPLVAKLIGQEYKFTDVYPGTYRLSLSPNRFCWSKDSHDIVINSNIVTAPSFIQSGYSVKFISSHNTKISYKLMQDSIQEDIEIKKGESTYCLPKDGTYSFYCLGCHTYLNDTFTFNTETEVNEIKLEAVSHLNSICIASNMDHGPVNVSIDIGGEKFHKGPLPYENGCYMINIKLEPDANAVILPQSERYYFKPPIFSIKGKNDCFQWGQLFEAIKGHVFKGKTIPPLSGTLITLEDENGEKSVTETDSSGFYKFPPMDTSKNYKIYAKKTSYQLVGPSENGDFTAYKLAQVIVTVLDENQLPLQGTLLSLSGGLSYRSNLQTDEQGKISFDSLNPSEYYLRPMMKEYSFEPPSKIINVDEGETINITLIGKRVAYSAFGIVTSLNKIPEHDSVVEAVGVKNCSHLSEETTTESNGRFRVRGLQPYCTYHLRAKDPSVEQCIPEFIEIKDIVSDIKDVHLIVLRPKKHTKVLVRINTDVPEYSKHLKLNLYLKGSPTTPVHSVKMDTNKLVSEYNLGIIIHLLPLPKDGKTYVLQLEPIMNQNVRWLTQSVSFIADTNFKSIVMEYSVKSSNTDQQIKQTSIWSFILIITSLLIAYNIDIVIRLANEKFNLKLRSFTSLFKLPAAADYPTNEVDIDQIVQNINSVKKKPKRNF
ncbi:nodal modulator 1 [Coccinella septempunctata]|uniref:nodal modulator 1 n=1 Tax=Coccinella septempunctata TaxID=41139 RepID=UPI001D08569B|nr:nodal modulator 1 [Coccinella septempunctata]